MKFKPLESKGLKIRPKPAAPGTRMPRAFVADFQSVAVHEKWDAQYTADMKEWIKASPNQAESMDYIATLAHAYRNWYAPSAENNYVRVHAWLQQVGLEPVTTYTREQHHETAAKKYPSDDRPGRPSRTRAVQPGGRNRPSR